MENHIVLDLCVDTVLLRYEVETLLRIVLFRYYILALLVRAVFMYYYVF